MRLGGMVFPIEDVVCAHIATYDKLTDEGKTVKATKLKIVMSDTLGTELSIFGTQEELEAHLEKIQQALEALDAVAMVPWKPSPWWPYVTNTGFSNV